MQQGRHIQHPNSASQIFITGEVRFLDKNILFYLNACRELIQNVYQDRANGGIL